MSEPRRLLLLTFRLDVDQRQRLKARLAAEGRTMSEVITSGLRQYVQRPGEDAAPPALPASPAPPAQPASPALPAETAARLRELRASGRSGVLSATLSALHADGWPLPALAEALGVSRQAIQSRIRQRVPAELRDRAADCAPPPPFPRRREPRKGRLRPHLTIKIDHALRSAAHLAAAREGHSLSQVVETILERYLRHGLPDAPGKPRRRLAFPGRGGGRGEPPVTSDAPDSRRRSENYCGHLPSRFGGVSVRNDGAAHRIARFTRI